MDFEKFLDEKAFVDHTDCLGNPIHKSAVYLKDLGEWAWNKTKPFIISPEAIKMFKNNSQLSHLEFGDVINEGLIYKEIAIACLGEKEIKKRIEKIKHDQRYGDKNGREKTFKLDKETKQEI